MEKKIHRDEPLKEITKITKSPHGHLQRRLQNAAAQVSFKMGIFLFFLMVDKRSTLIFI